MSIESNDLSQAQMTTAAEMLTAPVDRRTDVTIGGRK